MHAADLAVLGGLEPGLLATELVVLPGDVHALTGPLADQVGLELGDDSEDLQEHPGERVVPVVCRPSEREPDSPGRQLAQDVQRVGQGLVEARPGTARAGEPLVEVDAVGQDPERCERLALGGEILGQGGAPGVSSA
jgi:hypothetical protein